MRLLVTLLLGSLIVSCSGGASTTTVFVELTPSEWRPFEVEIADSAEEQQRGLMGRESLPPQAGMLFVWEDVAERAFYMKDTLIPLDLIAIAEGKVVSIHTMEPCTQTPCPNTFTAPADSALEINAGIAERDGIKVGARVSVGRPPAGT